MDLLVGLESRTMGVMAARKHDEPSAGSGFRAVLRGISVSDLVQMNCLSGATCTVRVVSHDRVGWLQFSGGSIAHAATNDLAGDDVALEILSWEDGTLEPSSTSTPERQSVTSSWQNLLMRAAQLRDESSRSNVVPMTQRAGGVLPTTASPISRTSGSVPNPPSTPSPPRVDVPPRPTLQLPPRTDATSYVRLNAAGKATTTRGDAEQLGALAAFAVHLGQKIGADLGLGTLLGMEAKIGARKTIVAVDANDQIEAMASTSESELTIVRRNARL